MSNNPKDEQVFFIETLEKYLAQVLREKFLNKKLNKETISEIKKELHEKFSKVFFNCKINISDTSVNFVVDEYFSNVVINGATTKEMLIMHEPNADDVPSYDLDILCKIFHDTTVGDKLEESRKKR